MAREIERTKKEIEMHLIANEVAKPTWCNIILNFVAISWIWAANSRVGVIIKTLHYYIIFDGLLRCKGIPKDAMTREEWLVFRGISPLSVLSISRRRRTEFGLSALGGTTIARRLAAWTLPFFLNRSPARKIRKGRETSRNSPYHAHRTSLAKIVDCSWASSWL